MFELLLNTGERHSLRNLSGGSPWKHQNGFNDQVNNLGTWTINSNTLPDNGRYVHEAIITKNKLHIIGGQSNTDPAVHSKTIFTFNIPSNGVIDFSKYTTQEMSVTMRDISISSTGTHIYLMGLEDDSRSGKVFSMRITEDGELDDFKLAYTNNLTRFQARSFTYNDRIYFVGGIDLTGTGNVTVDEVISYKYNSDGTLSDKRVESEKLPRTRARHTQVVIDGWVYVFGGIEVNGGTGTNTIYKSKINPNGTLGKWSLHGTLPFINSRADIIATDNDVYLYGGIGPNTSTNAAWRFKITNTLSSPTNVTNLPHRLLNYKAVITSSRVYMLGGVITGRSNPSDIIYQNFNGGLNDYSNYL